MIKFGAPTVSLMGRSMASDKDQAIDLHPVTFEDFKPFTPEKGFLYTASRAISSRVNANYDGWPVDQIKKSYKTFIGRHLLLSLPQTYACWPRIFFDDALV